MPGRKRIGGFKRNIIILNFVVFALVVGHGQILSDLSSFPQIDKNQNDIERIFEILDGVEYRLSEIPEPREPRECKKFCSPEDLIDPVISRQWHWTERPWFKQNPYGKYPAIYYRYPTIYDALEYRILKRRIKSIPQPIQFQAQTELEIKLFADKDDADIANLFRMFFGMKPVKRGAPDE